MLHETASRVIGTRQKKKERELHTSLQYRTLLPYIVLTLAWETARRVRWVPRAPPGAAPPANAECEWFARPRSNVGPVTRPRGSGRREGVDMERGGKGGRSPRTGKRAGKGSHYRNSG